MFWLKKIGKILLILLLGFTLYIYIVNAKEITVLDNINLTGKYSALIFFGILSMIIISSTYILTKSANKNN